LPSSTDVIVTDQRVYAFGVEFETGYTNDAFVHFGRSVYNPKFTGLVLDGFYAKINRIVGTLDARQSKFRKSGWLYLEIEYSLNCRKIERKF
jgi:hypothetical protein